jgi:hypothetical protein
MVADRASYRSACCAVVTCHVTRDAADYGAFDTAFRVRRINGCQANQYCYARTCKERFHHGLRSLARCNKSTHACFVPALNLNFQQADEIILKRRDSHRMINRPAYRSCAKRAHASVADAPKLNCGNVVPALLLALVDSFSFAQS